MELANMLFEFFGFQNLSDSATLVDFVVWFCKCGCGIWLVMFIIRSLFLVIRSPELRF